MNRNYLIALIGALCIGSPSRAAGVDTAVQMATIEPAQAHRSVLPERWDRFRTDLIDILASVMHHHADRRILFLGNGVRLHYDVFRRLTADSPEGYRPDSRFQAASTRIEEHPQFIDLVLQELDVPTLPTKGAVILCLEPSIADVLTDALPADLDDRIQILSFPRAQFRVANSIPFNGLPPNGIEKQAEKLVPTYFNNQRELNHGSRIRMRQLVADLAFSLDPAAFWEKVATGDVIPSDELFYVEEEETIGATGIIPREASALNIDEEYDLEESDPLVLREIWALRPRHWERIITTVIENPNPSNGLLLAMVQQTDSWERNPYTQERVFRILLALRRGAVTGWLERNVLPEERWRGNTHPGARRTREALRRAKEKIAQNIPRRRGELLLSIAQITHHWIARTTDWHRHREWESDPDNHRGLVRILRSLIRTGDSHVLDYLRTHTFRLTYWNYHPEAGDLLNEIEIARLQGWFHGRPNRRPCSEEIAGAPQSEVEETTSATSEAYEVAG